jgi:hypothetical protein
MDRSQLRTRAFGGNILQAYAAPQVPFPEIQTLVCSLPKFEFTWLIFTIYHSVQKATYYQFLKVRDVNFLC